jgi:small subunit ribosomal protein S4
VQLREKQKARRIYGVLERQFQRHYRDAGKQGGPRGERLLQQLELRADNVVYRMGLGLSRAHARQLTMHGHVELNGRKHDIPSAVLSVGDTIRLRGKSRDIDSVKNAMERAEALGRPDWLTIGEDAFEGTVNAIPERGQIDATLNEQLIVEFYSR